MDPERVRSYLQVACAGLGFDIGEVWWMSNENGTSTVASITENHHNNDTEKVMARPKKRFLQLYTSKAYFDQRSKLVQPRDEANFQFEDKDTQNDAKYETSTNEKSRSIISSHSLVLQNNNKQHPTTEDDEHVLSPRIVEAVTKTAQIVWANCQLKQQNVGLLGRSDIKLQTAIGMPVGMDDAGHVWVVVMFSPKNIQSSSDAIEYLQYIGRSAGSSSIPCLLPVVRESSTNGATTATINNEETEEKDEEDKNISSKEQSQQSHTLMSMKPSYSKPSNSINQTQDLLGEGVTAKFVAFNVQDDDDTKAAQENALRRPHRTSISHINDLRNAPQDVFGIPMLPPQDEDRESNNDYVLDNALITDVFDEASYGVWSTIMNSASGNAIRTSTTIASKMEIIQERLEEFLCAFLGMSVFDVGDVWILSSSDTRKETNSGVRDEKKKALQCLFTVAATNNNPQINTFRAVNGNALVQIGDGAVGKAFSSGYPVWSSDKSLIHDCNRSQALEDCHIETIFAVPIFSAGDVHPSCVLSCYSLLPAESVPFVVNFVQKAVRLLWDGLDQIDPHESVGKVLWENVSPSDLGEMAADVEMQEAFIGKKRPHSGVTQQETNSDQVSVHRRTSSSSLQMRGQSDFHTGLPPSTIINTSPPAKGLSPAPLLPTALIAPSSQQMVSENCYDDIGHWAVQQAVQSVGNVQQWNNTSNIQQIADGVQAQQQALYQGLISTPPQPFQGHQEFIKRDISQGQPHLFTTSQSSMRPISHPSNLSPLAYVDHKTPPELITTNTNPLHPSHRSGVYIDPKPVIQANLDQFNAMALMYRDQEAVHPRNNLNETPVIHTTTDFLQPAELRQIDKMRVVPLSHAEGSVILTGPQQILHCVSTTQSLYVKSLNQPMCYMNAAKECRISGCSEQAKQRKPYCSKHCGNRQCEKEGCTKHAQGATRFCIAHGGGKRCTFPGCDKGARGRFFCAAHGGGKRCKMEGCIKSAVGSSHFCTNHGGGKRCMLEGCDKSAQSSTNFCVKHGGGKKCQSEGCEKVARGKTPYCAAHGGGIRCKLSFCNSVAIGKAQLCRAHGGGAKPFSTFPFSLP